MPDLNKTIEQAAKYLRSRGLDKADVSHAIQLLSEMTPTTDDDAPAGSINDNTVDRLLAFLQKGLPPELFEKIKAALNNATESAVEPAPSTRATVAADSFAEYFPEAMRIGVIGSQRPPAAPPSPSTATDFDARFPEAERIGWAW